MLFCWPWLLLLANSEFLQLQSLATAGLSGCVIVGFGLRIFIVLAVFGGVVFNAGGGGVFLRLLLANSGFCSSKFSRIWWQSIVGQWRIFSWRRFYPRPRRIWLDLAPRISWHRPFWGKANSTLSEAACFCVCCWRIAGLAAANFGGFGGRTTLATGGFSGGIVFFLGRVEFCRFWLPQIFMALAVWGRPIQRQGFIGLGTAIPWNVSVSLCQAFNNSFNAATSKSGGGIYKNN